MMINQEKCKEVVKKYKGKGGYSVGSVVAQKRSNTEKICPTLPFPYTSSPPPYLFPDLSSLLCLKCKLYFVYPSIYLQFSFAYNGPTNQNNQLGLGGSKLHSKL